MSEKTPVRPAHPASAQRVTLVTRLTPGPFRADGSMT